MLCQDTDIQPQQRIINPLDDAAAPHVNNPVPITTNTGITIAFLIELLLLLD